MEERAKDIQVVPFMHIERRRVPAVKPILVKVAFLVFMVTVAMILVNRGNILGYIIYGKEVVEFIVFVAYSLKRRKRE